MFPEITSTFLKMSTYPLSISKDDEKVIEKFIVLLYDISASFKVDKTLKKLYSQKKSLFDNIPPTSASMKQHVRRAAFQASIIWGQALKQVPD